jgi:hypothetical protein
MKLLTVGFVLLVLAIAIVVLFLKMAELEDKIEQAHRPKIELIAATVR